MVLALVLAFYGLCFALVAWPMPFWLRLLVFSPVFYGLGWVAWYALILHPERYVR